MFALPLDSLSGVEFHGRNLEIRFDKGPSSSVKTAVAAPEPVRLTRIPFSMSHTLFTIQL